MLNMVIKLKKNTLQIARCLSEILKYSNATALLYFKVIQQGNKVIQKTVFDPPQKRKTGWEWAPSSPPFCSWCLLCLFQLMFILIRNRLLLY